MSKHARFGSEQESSKEMEEEASEELDYGDSDYEDTEATIQARRRVLEKPGSSKDHEARAQSKLGARPSSAPLTKKRAVPNPPFDYEPFNYQGYIQQELKKMNESLGKTMEARFTEWLDKKYRNLTPEEKGKQRTIPEDLGLTSSKKRRAVTDRPLLADAGAGRGGPSSSAPTAKRPRQVHREPSIDQTSSEISSMTRFLTWRAFDESDVGIALSCQQQTIAMNLSVH